MDESRSGWQRTQRAFAAYIRDPQGCPMPADVAPLRMATYRELFFNNIESFLAAGFPVLKSILHSSDWIELIKDFFARHRSRTPFFAEITKEFLEYLGKERNGHPNDPVFLRELAHYEWVELALAIAEAEVPDVNSRLEQDPLSRTLRLSEVAWPLAYCFPVHRIGPSFQPTEPPAQATYLLVYRDREDTVRFVETNPVTHRLLELLEDNGPLTGTECLRRIAEELRHPAPEAVLTFGAEILRDLAERGVIGLD